MGLKHALSAKMKEGKLVIVDGLTCESHKTQALKKKLDEHDWHSALFIDVGNSTREMDGNFRLAVGNLPRFDILPQIVSRDEE